MKTATWGALSMDGACRLQVALGEQHTQEEALARCEGPGRPACHPRKLLGSLPGPQGLGATPQVQPRGLDST